MYEVSTKEKKYSYSYHPKNVEGILQRLEVLLGIYRGEIPLAREIGIDSSIIDRPTNMVKPLLKRELQKQIKTYIPEILLKQVEFDVVEGKVEIKCAVEAKDEYK